MALDKKKMQERLKSLNSGETFAAGGGNNSKWLRMKAPDKNHKVRLLTSKSGDPFKEYQMHYGLDKVSFVCPRMFGEKCAFCDHGWELWKKGSHLGKDNPYNGIKNKLTNSVRYYSVVIDRADEDAGPKIWSYSKKTYGKLLTKIMDPELGDDCDVTDPKTGYDIILNYDYPVSATGKPASYPEYELSVSRSSSPLHTDDAVIEGWMDSIPDIDETMSKKTTEETEEALEKWKEKVINSTQDKEVDKYGGDEEEESKGESDDVSDDQLDDFDVPF